MKTFQKILTVLVIMICIAVAMPQNISRAVEPYGTDGSGSRGHTSVSSIIGSVSVTDPDASLSDGLSETIGKLLGFLQVASGLIAILMIAITGFNYIIATPDVKEEMKKKMLPIIIGLVIVFGAVSIAKFILGAVGG